MQTTTHQTQTESSLEKPGTHTPPDFVTPEMVEKNSLMDMIGAFANDPIYALVVKEIAKERARQRRRDMRNDAK